MKEITHKLKGEITFEKPRITGLPVLCIFPVNFVRASSNWRGVTCRRCRKIGKK